MRLGNLKNLCPNKELPQKKFKNHQTITAQNDHNSAVYSTTDLFGEEDICVAEQNFSLFFIFPLPFEEEYQPVYRPGFALVRLVVVLWHTTSIS